MLASIIDVFFPKRCFCCEAQLEDFEFDVCVTCRHDLPVTNFHELQNNEVFKLLYGRIKIEQATALFYFYKKGIVQHMLHNLKYKGNENIGVFTGKWLGSELSQIESYKNIDIVIPVPIHKKRLKERGYNQVAKFSKEISKSLNANYIDDILLKKSKTKTQVFKDRFKRWKDIQGTFHLSGNAKKIEGKHILLTDDVITTGATIETCTSLLLQIKNVKISVAFMAITMS